MKKSKFVPTLDDVIFRDRDGNIVEMGKQRYLQQWYHDKTKKGSWWPIQSWMDRIKN